MAPKLKRSEIVRPLMLVTVLAALIVLIVTVQVING